MSKTCAPIGRSITPGNQILSPQSAKRCTGFGKKLSLDRSIGWTSTRADSPNSKGAPMASPLFGEFMGTAVLILLGNGVVANVLLRKSKGEGGGAIVISAGWSFAVLFGVMTAIACGSQDANLNPAVT